MVRRMSTARAEYYWATAMVNLPVPALGRRAHAPVQGVQTMVDRVVWAVEQL